MTNGYAGPSRARYMADLKDAIDLMSQDQALSEAAARRIYGADYVTPEKTRGDLAGGSIDNGQHIDLGRLSEWQGRRRPKSGGPWPWIFGIVSVLALTVASLLVASWLLNPQPKQIPGGVQVPGNFQLGGGPFTP